jgi:hypothetical protein
LKENDMPTVIYGKRRVSDIRLQDMLQHIAQTLGRDIRVTSGDRSSIVQGSSSKSLHLINEAVDFHVIGLSDAEAFQIIREDRTIIFGQETGAAYRWQLIRHGPHTKTNAPHLHLGFSPLDGPIVNRGFLVEGLVPNQPYTVVEGP